MLKKNIHEKTIGLHAWIIDYIYINDISICHFLFIYVKVMYICVVCTYKYNIILYYIIHCHFITYHIRNTICVYTWQSYSNMCDMYIYNHLKNCVFPMNWNSGWPHWPASPQIMVVVRGVIPRKGLFLIFLLDRQHRLPNCGDMLFSFVCVLFVQHVTNRSSFVTWLFPTLAPLKSLTLSPCRWVNHSILKVMLCKGKALQSSRI